MENLPHPHQSLAQISRLGWAWVYITNNIWWLNCLVSPGADQSCNTPFLHTREGFEYISPKDLTDKHWIQINEANLSSLNLRYLGSAPGLMFTSFMSNKITSSSACLLAGDENKCGGKTWQFIWKDRLLALLDPISKGNISNLNTKALLSFS